MKCESCIEGFYQDPAVVDANGELDLNSPDICKRKFYHSENMYYSGNFSGSTENF